MIPIAHTHESNPFESFLLLPPEATPPVPLVLIVPDWWGFTDRPFARAERIVSELGIAAGVVDLYGKGVRPANTAQCAQHALPLKADRPRLRERFTLALHAFCAHGAIDATRLLAMGYCFGGQAALELARSGTALRGAASFHGALDTPDPSLAANIRCPLLVMHGAKDPHIPRSHVVAFMDEMDAAGVDYHFVQHGNAMHSFTNAQANDPANGFAYHPAADAESWALFARFIQRVFAS